MFFKKLWKKFRDWYCDSPFAWIASFIAFFVPLYYVVQRWAGFFWGIIISAFAITLFDETIGERIRGWCRISQLKERETAADKKETELAAKEKELNDREKRIDNLVKEKIIRQVQDISHRDYLVSTPAFRELNTSKDLDRFSSVLTQDISIHPPFDITAKIHSKNSNKTYTTTLWKCSCDDFKNNHQSPCKHMLRLAIEVGSLIAADDEALQTKLRNEAGRLQEKAYTYNKAKAAAKRAIARYEKTLKNLR